MNTVNNGVPTPNFEGEEMKLPENTDAQRVAVEKSSIINAPLLFTLTVLLLVILGGMYYWFSTLEPTEEILIPPPAESILDSEDDGLASTTVETQTNTRLTTSTSDEIDAIESDIESTNIEDFDSELNSIELELNSALE